MLTTANGWPRHGGEMGERIRSHDWAATPLGPIKDWPQSLRTAVDIMLSSPEPASVIWGGERIQLYNDAYVPIAADRHPRLLGRPISENWPEACTRFLGPILDRVYDGEAVVLNEQVIPLWRSSRKGFADRVFTATFSPIHDDTDTVVGVFHPLTETTSYSRASAALRESEAKLRLITDNLPALIGYHDRKQRYVWVNEEFSRFFGVPREMIVGKTMKEWLKPHVYERLRPWIEAALRGERVSFEHMEPDKLGPGLHGWTEENYIPDVAPDGKIRGFFVLAIDITQRKQAEERLRASEERFAAIFASASVGLSEVGLDGRFLRVNDELCRIIGRSREELLKLGIADVTHANDLTASFDVVQRVLTNGGAASLDKRYCRPDGTTVWANSTATRLHDSQGRPGNLLVVTVDLSARRQAEEAVRASEERLRLATEGAGMGTWDFDLLTNTGMWSESGFRIMGYEPRLDQRWPLEAWSALLHPDDLPRSLAAAAAAKVSRGSFSTEYRIKRADDGRERWVQAFGHYLYDSTGEAVRYVGVFFDVTERKQAEAALAESEQRYRLAVDVFQGGVAEYDVLTGRTSASRAFYRLLGDEPETSGHTLADFFERVHPDDRARVEDSVQSLVAGEAAVIDDEYRALHADGRWIHLWTRAVALHDENGRTLKLVTTTVDITARRQAEEALRASEERFRQFAEASPDILWIRNAETLRYEYLSPAFERIYGHSRTSVLRGNHLRNWATSILPDDRSQAFDSIRRAREGERTTLEYRIRRSNGHLRWLRNTDFPITDAEGRVRRIAGIGQDVTAAKAAEAALAESEQRLRTLTEGIPQLVWRAVDAGAWTWASPQWTAYTGQNQAHSCGHGWLGPVYPEDRDAAKAAWAKAEQAGGFDVEYRIRRASDGRYRWFRTRAVPVRDQADRVIEWLGTSTDIDDLRVLQERQQLLLAELQHRVRNTLAIVRSIARRTAASNDTIEDYTAHFDGRLNAFARTQAAVTRDPSAGVDLGTIISEELVAHGAREGVQVCLAGPMMRLQPRAAEALGLAVHELATNAVKYGALSTPIGRIDVRWIVEGHEQRPHLRLQWIEDMAGRMIVPPQRRGFGLEMLERTLAYDLAAETQLDFVPGGLRCVISLPLNDRVRVG